ncbi:tagaturonate epimerase family protein [candidate division NPL-UPA2 bacterium]|nr:tagaturonate epimerase family protein [candidate division NPL-UPA2 bacterium]
MSAEQLNSAFEELFDSQAEKKSLLDTCLGRSFECEGFQITFEEEDLRRTSVKYLSAIRHVIKMSQHLCKLQGEQPFDFEVSIDETDLPTSARDHLFIITQLINHGVKVTSLAPRFVGQFQKAIDYIGDIQTFTHQLKQHAAIARQYGNYKMSIHSGSDKFSIFGVMGKITQGLFHEKTAGTSYLEAIRTVARNAPHFYRQIHKFALSRFEQDRASYQVTTDLAAIPEVDKIADGELDKLFHENNARQLIHITYGSVLQASNENGQYIDENEEEYMSLLDRHISRHLESFDLKKR